MNVTHRPRAPLRPASCLLGAGAALFLLAQLGCSDSTSRVDDAGAKDARAFADAQLLRADASAADAAAVDSTQDQAPLRRAVEQSFVNVERYMSAWCPCRYEGPLVSACINASRVHAFVRDCQLALVEQHVASGLATKAEVLAAFACEAQADQNYISCLQGVNCAAADRAQRIGACLDTRDAETARCAGNELLKAARAGLLACATGPKRGCPAPGQPVSRVGKGVFVGTTYGMGRDFAACGTRGAPDAEHWWTAPRDGNYVFDIRRSTRQNSYLVLLDGCPADGAVSQEQCVATGWATRQLTAGQQVLLIVAPTDTGIPVGGGDYIVDIQRQP
ncbi:MAG: hypothetical protein H6707_04025 [Deltaproteobacteria bacterium]|nr:hypothetical protein [Deltaproteobacteria bacterium]